jgi:DNA polymerase III delta subunit
MVYLFIGQDSLSKDIKLKRLKQEFLAKELEQFNLDTLYAKELTLRVLQERMLCLPVKAKKRIIVIKEAQNLKEDTKEFILKYLTKPEAAVILVLDIDRYDRRDEFLNSIYKYAEVFRFSERVQPDAFVLNRQISLGRADYALRVLNQLLKDGERPERILGGLRYAWERDVRPQAEMRKRLGLLLKCDVDIKTGRLKPNFALERLVVSLCGLTKPFH